MTSEGAEVELQAFLTSALDGGERYVSYLRHFTLKKEPTGSRMGTRASLNTVKRKIEPRFPGRQPVA
jgi:hypothetical protein